MRRKSKWLYIPGIVILLWVFVLGGLRTSLGKVIAEEEVGRAYALRINDVLYAHGNIDIDSGIKLQQENQKDPAVFSITMRYMDAAVRSIALSQEFQTPNVDRYEKRLIRHVEKRAEEAKLTVEKEALYEVVADASHVLETYVEGLLDPWYISEFIPWAIPAAILYYYTITPFYALVLVLSGIVFWVLANKYNDWKTTGDMLLITCVISLICGIMIYGSSLWGANRLLGRSLQLSFWPFLSKSMILLGFGCFVRYFVSHKKC